MAAPSRRARQAPLPWTTSAQKGRKATLPTTDPAAYKPDASATLLPTAGFRTPRKQRSFAPSCLLPRPLEKLRTDTENVLLTFSCLPGAGRRP